MEPEKTDLEICVAAIEGSWPKEALPEGVDFSPARYGDPDHFTLGVGWDDSASGTVSGDLQPQHAAALFRDSGLGWLTSQRPLVLLNECADGSYGISLQSQHNAPTLLSAIDKTIRIRIVPVKQCRK